jgi:hypothetical protein
MINPLTQPPVSLPPAENGNPGIVPPWLQPDQHIVTYRDHVVVDSDAVVMSLDAYRRIETERRMLWQQIDTLKARLGEEHPQG